MAIVKEKIAGLYIAFFNRAADEEGLNYWLNQSNTLGEETVIKQLATGFATHPKFVSLYDSLDNQEYVETIYLNVLGQAGDSDGINYWKTLLDNGMSHSDMVADFVSISLDFERNDPQYTLLSEDELDAAQERKDLITNKVSISLEFVEVLKEKTNLAKSTDAMDSNSLDNDASYLSSIKILSQITSDISSSENVKDYLSSSPNISDINNLTTLELENIIAGRTSKLILASDISNVNYSYSNISNLQSFGVDTLSSGEYWNINEDITFSFNNSIPSDYYDYGFELVTLWQSLNENQRESVREIILELNKYINIQLYEVDSNGLIQFNLVYMDYDTAAFAFYPGDTYEYLGDVFLNEYDYNNIKNPIGLESKEYGWSTIVHELGHALGLKHPFEDSVTLDSQYDNTQYTIMSYTEKQQYIVDFMYNSSNGEIISKYLDNQSELYSLFDISALQAIYGVNSETNLEDSIYKFSFDDYRFFTIWDAGGNDTIDLSSSSGNSTIDLNSGSLNSADEYSLSNLIDHYLDLAHKKGATGFDDWIESLITEDYNNNILYTGENNLAIANGVLIEQIYTGIGNDIITDNEVDNIISTSLGDDTIYLGNGGYDLVDGGEGVDTINLDTYFYNEINTMIDDDKYILYNDSFASQLENIEFVQFKDTYVSFEDIFIA